ncbi:tRNA (N(6)-L-threonylcarbamoyladenosine(37)-C(2))-methylthiotransferase [Candidatus Aenigmatarchaeota archaeon]
MKIYIETYGCSSNQNDSQIMVGILKEKGHQIVESENADIIIINTCTVKHTTEQKIRHKISSFSNKKLIVAGCMAETQPDLIRSLAPNASLLGTNKIHHIDDVVHDLINGKRTEFLGKQKIEKPLLTKQRTNSVIDIVEIESGCNYACSFCETKLAKGPTFSYSPENIINQMQKMRNQGVREFWITGQDVAGYNKDNVNLPGLIEKIISNVKGVYFLRIGMHHPSSIMPILKELIDVYKNERVFKFLHLPVQSGSENILKKMNRSGTAEEYKKIISAFRKEIPEITIWTDVIVGFPGETEDDFKETLSLIKETKPDFTNISSFSVRKNTKAAKMPQVKSEIKKERTRLLSELCNKISIERNERWIDWSGLCIIDEFNSVKQNWIGRNHAYKPITINSNLKFGDFCSIKIVGCKATHLKGVAG